MSPRTTIETAFMRTVATGFLLGYLTISLLIAPTMLWALDVAPTYSKGVVMVLDRSGVLGPMRDAVDRAVVARDNVMALVGNYVANKFSQHLPG